MPISVFGRGGSRRAQLAVLVVVAFGSVPGCGSDHRALALRPHPGGAAGMGGASGTGGAGGRGGAVTKPSTGGSSAVANPNKHVDQPGRSVFTVVHGIADAGPTAWCFARVRDGVTKLVGDPVPDGGLDYAQSLSFESLPSVRMDSDGVVPYVITGDLAELGGLDCEAAVALAQAVMATDRGSNGGDGGAAGASDPASGAGEAGAAGATSANGGAGGESSPGAAEPPRLRVGALPSLAPGLLAQGYSVLEVADGCFGARAFHDRSAGSACGADYTPEHGSLSAELVILARDTFFDKLALQALDASRGTDRMGVQSAPGPLDSAISSITLVDNFTEGTLRPRDPRVDLQALDWGANKTTWTVDATVDGTRYASVNWKTVRKNGRIDQLEDGRGYTLIALGPSFLLDRRGFWNDFTFTVVDNDPPVSP